MRSGDAFRLQLFLHDVEYGTLYNAADKFAKIDGPGTHYTIMRSVYVFCKRI